MGDLATETNWFGLENEMYLALCWIVSSLLPPQRFPSQITAVDCVRICFRFICGGQTFGDIANSLRLPKHLVKQIVLETCKSISIALEHLMPIPTQDDWKVIEKNFSTKKKFPQCHGVLDGLYIKTKSDTRYLCCLSQVEDDESCAVMYTLLDSSYKFIMFEVVLDRPENDFQQTHMAIQMNGIKTGLSRFPSIFVAKEGFDLTEKILTPYSITKGQHARKMKFNVMHQKVMDCSQFGLALFCSNFLVINNMQGVKMKYLPEIMKACCLVHNFLIDEVPSYSHVLNMPLAVNSRLRMISTNSTMDGLVNRERIANLFYKKVNFNLMEDEEEDGYGDDELGEFDETDDD